jgi:hypothetical protein
MSKKLIVSCALVLSLALVGVIGVSAAIDTNGRYVPSEGVEETHRVYFLMPESWKSEKFNANDAGAYWWNGSDAGSSLDGTSVGVAWPGYKMQVENAENNIFYLDLPTDVPNLDFNNYLNGGLRTEDAATGLVRNSLRLLSRLPMFLVSTIRKATMNIMTICLTANSGQRLRKHLTVMIRHSSVNLLTTSLRILTGVSQCTSPT